MAQLDEYGYFLLTEEEEKLPIREQFPIESARLEALIEQSNKAIERGELKGTLFHTPVGDGAAWYIVTKVRPFTLQKVCFGDNWDAPWYIIDGLTANAMREFNRREAAFRAIFSKRT